MSDWRVVYDTASRFSQAFGRSLVIEAADAAEADAVARATVAAAEPGATMTRLVVTPVTPVQAAALRTRAAQVRTWLANVAKGMPNPRGSL